MTQTSAAIRGAPPPALVIAAVFLAAAVLQAAAPAAAQSNVGAGPLTVGLPDTEPAAAVIAWGPVRLAPGLTVHELGYDDNVFMEAEDPKDDWLVSATPDLQLFTRLRLFRIAAYTGVNLTYYDTYTSERSVSEQYRGRVDVLLSNIRPFVGGGWVTQRTRPNGEISVRADQLLTEVSGGVAYDLSSTSRFWGSAERVTTEYRTTEQFEGVPLDESLNRNAFTYQGGLQTALTPLTTLTISGSYTEDRFRESPERNADSFEADAEFSFAPQAVIRGNARVGIRDFRPDDPTIEPYTGLVVGVGLAVPVMDAGRFNFGVFRDAQYSFDETDAYYVENTFEVIYTHFIFGQVDLQGRGGWSGFDYGHRQGEDPRRDTLTTWAVGVGYNLRNRTRMSVQFEDAQRRSKEIADRNYDRRRVYFSWTFSL